MGIPRVARSSCALRYTVSSGSCSYSRYWWIGKYIELQAVAAGVRARSDKSYTFPHKYMGFADSSSRANLLAYGYGYQYCTYTHRRRRVYIYLIIYIPDDREHIIFFNQPSLGRAPAPAGVSVLLTSTSSSADQHGRLLAVIEPVAVVAGQQHGQAACSSGLRPNRRRLPPEATSRPGGRAG